MPLELGTTVLLKVVTYDTTFDARSPGEFVVLIPYADDGSRALAAVEQLANVARSRIRARPLSFHAVKSTELSAEAKARKASAILALEGTPDSVLAEIARAGKELRAYTLGLGEDAVKASVAIGVTMHDGKPQITVNIERARSTGVELPQSILKVARLLR